MEKLKGFEEARVITGESTQVPAGGYIAKIMACKEIKGTGWSYLEFSFDIDDGEYKDHFSNIYKASKDENKKWKGIYRAFIPQEKDPYYEDKLTKFKTMMTAFEDSNKGYHWDWDEGKLKDKTVGVIFGEKEFRPDGKNDILIITEARWLCNVQQIKDKKYKMPQLRKLPSSSGMESVPDFMEDDSSDPLPF